MNKILSQAEIDALLNAVSETASDNVASDETGVTNKTLEKGNIKNTNIFAQDKITPYDLTNQNKVIRGKLPTLDVIYERFSRLFRISLSTSLRKMASISVISTDLLKFGEFVNTLPIPSCMGILKFDALKGSGLIVLETKLAYSFIDHFFGGTDFPYVKVKGKEFTRIELSILKKVMELAVKDLDEAWSPVYKTELAFVRPEVNPQFVGLVPSSDVIISTTFEVELESSSGTLVIVVPYTTIEPIKNKLNTSFQTDMDRSDRELTEKMQEHLIGTSMSIVVNLGHVTITLADLVNLSVGDVIPLNQDADGELDVLIEGIPKFKCLLGISRGNRAVQLTKIS